VGQLQCTDTLDMVYGIREVQKRSRGHSDHPLWPCARNTAWRYIKNVMLDAGIPDDPHRSPKCLCHSYGVHAISLRYRPICSRNGWAMPALR
jgi:hypothetical protein